MKLAKAIEIGELNINEAGNKMPADTLDALKVLVEAGKAIELWRKEPVLGQPTHLSGETDE